MTSTYYGGLGTIFVESGKLILDSHVQTQWLENGAPYNCNEMIFDRRTNAFSNTDAYCMDTKFKDETKNTKIVVNKADFT